MKRWNRLFYYLMINILVSLCVTLAVLVIWDRTHPATPGDQKQSTRISSISTLSTVQTALPAEAGESSTQPAAGQIINPTENAPTPRLAQPVTEYEVQPGDTLGAIAEKFDITTEDLLYVNPDITDPDRLDVGQVLNIPVQATATAELIPTDTPVLPQDTPVSAPTGPTATAAVGEPQVIIFSVVGAGDLASERVLLKCLGSGKVPLTGWQMIEEGGKVYTFPQLDIYAGGEVDLYTRAGQDTVIYLYWGLSSAIWQSGENIVLVDDQGKVRATYTVP